MHCGDYDALQRWPSSLLQRCNIQIYWGTRIFSWKGSIDDEEHTMFVGNLLPIVFSLITLNMCLTNCSLVDYLNSFSSFT
jgi:hypothetical protein